MANVDTPFGLKPVRMLDGSPFNGCVDMFYVPSSDATAYYIGDPVKPAGSADAAGVMSVAQCAAGDPILGSVVGFADATSMAAGYGAASTIRYVLVAHGQDILFEIQEDADGGALAAADIGLNAAIIVGSPNTTMKRSGVELDTSTKNTTATLALRIRGLAQRPDNELSANSKVLVSINEAFDTPGTASDGL